VFTEKMRPWLHVLFCSLSPTNGKYRIGLDATNKTIAGTLPLHSHDIRRMILAEPMVRIPPALAVRPTDVDFAHSILSLSPLYYPAQCTML
jgi:hypothetical protein